MLTADEIRENLAGAWLVMNGDSDGLERMDTTIEGFWRSFGAIVLLIPIFALSVLGDRQLATDLDLADKVRPVPVEALILLVEWMLFPALMALFARPAGYTSRYVPFIVARNWSSVVTSAFFAIPLLAYLGGIVSVQMLFLFVYIILGAVGYFSYRIARTALQASPGLAAGIVAAEFGLSLMIDDLVRALTA